MDSINIINLDEAIQYLIKNDYHNINQVKITLTEDFEDLTQQQLDLLNDKFKDSTIFISIASKSNRYFKILWKTEIIKKVLLLNYKAKDNPEDTEKLLEITLKFLENCLENGNLGILNEPENSQSQFELQHLINHDNFNLLHYSVVNREIDFIEVLINNGISPNSPNNDINAQTLAWTYNYHDVLLKLLKLNLPFPNSFKDQISLCTGELRLFIETCLQFHKFIKDNKNPELEKWIVKNPNIKICFNLSNDSALKVALDKGKINIYDKLIKNNFNFGPHESIYEIWGSLNIIDKEDMYKIHLKHAKEFPEKHINTLMMNTCLSHDENDSENKSKYILKAYRALNSNENLQTILKIVAAVKCFKIVFDFQSSSTYRFNPTTNTTTTGVFNFSGTIIIAAKSLLSESTEKETFGTIAHELCHFAVYAVFENKANPYFENDEVAKNDFQNILNICRERKDFHDVIRHVFDSYYECVHSSELIVRPAHLMALYLGNDECDELKKISDHYDELFCHFKKVILKMETALPDVESRFVTKTNYIYEKLSVVNQNMIKNAVVRFENIFIKLNEIFEEKSIVYKELKSDHLSNLLKRNILNLSDPELNYVKKHINFGWEKLANIFKNKVLDSYLNYQSQKVKFQIFDDCVLNHLTPDHVTQILNRQILVIGTQVQKTCNFFIDRKFIPEDARLISFEYKYGSGYVYVATQSEKHMLEKTKNCTFKEFLIEFFEKKNFKTYSQILDEIESNSFLKTLVLDLNAKEFDFLHKSSEEMIEIAKSEKILVLSSEAGAGKTETFKKFALETKEKYPDNWVSYIDLKEHTKNFQTKNANENVEHNIKEILGLNAKKNNIEIKIFENAYKSGKVVLVWNGFDEISPTFNKPVIEFMLSINNNSKNVQFICTRPICSNELRDSFSTRTWQLLPFSEENKQDFLKEYLEDASHNIDNTAAIIKINEIIKKFESYRRGNREFNTPLMLELIANVRDKIESYEIYEMYEKFVTDKINICLQHSHCARVITGLIQNGGFGDIFQKFSLLNELFIFSCSSLNLKLRKLQIMRKKNSTKFPIKHISCIGILHFNGQDKFDFIHKTFAEFFVAQYFMDKIYDADDDDINDEEAELRLELFFMLVQNYKNSQQLVLDFMHSSLRSRKHLDNGNFNEKIAHLLKTKFKNFFIKLLDVNHIEVFEFLFDFFKKDHDLLVELLHVNNDKTFYTEIFNPNNISIFLNPEDIKNLAQNCLSDEEMGKFLCGKNQTGKILFGIFFYNLISIKKYYENFYEEIQKIFTSNSIEVQNCHNISLHENLILFLIQVKVYLTIDEQKEFFKCAMSPIIYIFYEKFFIPSFFQYYQIIWEDYENILSTSEMQSAFGTALIHYFQIQSFYKKNSISYLNFLLEKMSKFLTHDQIYEIFLNENILHEVHWDMSSYDMVWKFLCTCTSSEQRKTILRKDDFDDRFFYFYFNDKDQKKVFIEKEYWYTYYDFTPFKIFHRSLLITYTGTLAYTIEIYQSHFNTEELQQLITESNDFLIYAIERVSKDSFKKFIEYLEKVFCGCENILIEFLGRKINPTGLTTFQFMDECREFVFSQSKWFDNHKALCDLFKKLNDKQILVQV